MIVKSITGKTMGHIENGVFHKKVRGSAHMLRCPPAWALDATAYNTIISKEAMAIEILDIESRLLYRVSIETFDAHKVLMDRRYGAQYYLPLHYWSYWNTNQGKLL